MDEILYEALTKYYHVLELKGYMSRKHSDRLLILCFYRDFVFNDYRGILKREDYHLIEKALDCIYGSSCLIPYPDYLKMGKLHLGEMTELSQRIKTLEDTEVVKVMHDLDSVSSDSQSDVVITEEEE